MKIIRTMRKQTAIWWPRLTKDRFGKYSFGEPQEISCRWESASGEMLTNEAEVEENRTTTVYVDRDMNPGDRLLLAALESGTSPDPLEVQALEIRKFSKIPDLKNKDVLRIANL